MKTADMIDEMETFYQDNQHLLDIAKITRQAYYSWLDSFTTHDTLRKAHRFVLGSTCSDIGTKTSLSRRAAVASMVYTDFPPDSWNMLFITAPSQFNVKQLKTACKEMNKVWLRRPRRKRGQE